LIIRTFSAKENVSCIIRSQQRVYQHVHSNTFGLRRRRKAGQLQNRPTRSVTALSTESNKKRKQDKQLNTTNVIFIAVSFICFLTCGCIFLLPTICGLLFITFCSSCFLCIFRNFACERLGGELRRMTWTLGIMTLYGRYLAVLCLAQRLVHSNVIVFCLLFQSTVQYLFSGALEETSNMH
jgi:hypothetical protein